MRPHETAILHKSLDLEIDMVLDVFSHLAISAFNSVDPGKCTSVCQYDQLTEPQFLLPLRMAYWNEESQERRNVYSCTILFTVCIYLYIFLLQNANVYAIIFIYVYIYISLEINTEELHT